MALLLALVVIAIAPFAIEALRRPMGPGARQSAEGQFARLSRGVTHYDWIGPAQGPVAVCVHGLTTPSFVWRGLARGLAALGFRVLIYDLYGRGYSDRPRGAQDRDFFLGQLDDLLADQDVQGAVTLLGYSMGGVIATAWAARHPERVTQLILIASAGIVVNPGKVMGFVRGTPVIGDWLMLAMFPRNHRRGTEADRGVSEAQDLIVDRQQGELSYRGFTPGVLASLRGILAEDRAPDHATLHGAGVPVLAIWGRDDDLIPITAMGQLAERIRNSRNEVIEGAGHSLTFTHTPQVLDAIRANITLPAP